MLTFGEAGFSGINGICWILIRIREHTGQVALCLHLLDGNSVSLRVEQEEKKRLQHPSNVMSLKDLTDPRSAYCTSARIPVA